MAENRYLSLTGGIALTTVYALTCYTVILTYFIKYQHSLLSSFRLLRLTRISVDLVVVHDMGGLSPVGPCFETGVCNMPVYLL